MANPTISQIAINGTTYDACDSQARADIKTLQDSVLYKTGGTITGNLQVNGTLKGYTWDLSTNNTTDTWVPVLNGSTIQHRVVPKNIDTSITNITRNGTTFTATRANGSTFTFTQQDNNSLTGVKGNAESSYRTGNVNLTPANIGAQAVLSVQTITGFTTASGYTLERAAMYKYGRIATLMIGVKNNNAWTANTNYTIGTVPSSVRPYGKDANGACFNPNTATWIETGGNVVVRSNVALGAGTYLIFTYTFITAS